MKALTVGGAMIDTIAIIASDRIERMTHDERRQLVPAAGGGAQDRGAGDLHPRRRRSGQRRRGDGAARPRRRRRSSSSARTRAPRRCWATCCRRACRRAGPCATAARRRAPRCWSPRTTATPPSSPSAAPTRCWRRPTCARRRSPPISSTSPRSATSRPTPFPPSSSVPRRKARWSPPTRGVRQLSSRGGAFQEALAQIDILAVNRSEADVLVPGLVARFGEGGSGACRCEPGEQLPRLAARGFVGGGHEMSLVAFFAALRKLGPALCRRHRRAPRRVPGHPGGDHVSARCWRPRSRARPAPGDAFNATFTACMALGRPPEEALRAARHQRRLGGRPRRHADRAAVARGDRQAPRRDEGSARGAHMVALA